MSPAQTRKIEEEKVTIEKYIRDSGNHVHKSRNEASSWVVYNDLPYELFLRAKKENIMLLHSFDILRFIKENPINCEYLDITYENDIDSYNMLMGAKPFNSEYSIDTPCCDIYSIGMEIENENPFGSIWYYEASLKVSDVWYYYPCYRLAVLYDRYKLYEELNRILGIALEKTERDYSYFANKKNSLDRKLSKQLPKKKL